MKLYQLSSSGKVKFLDIKTADSKLITEWGIIGGKTQKVEKICKLMNKGKANELTAKQQAIAEMKAKIVLKKKEGYSDILPVLDNPANEKGGEIDLDNIPLAFCPVKPISDCPESVLNSRATLAQRKHNGHCVFLVKGKSKSFVYSRRMEDLTAQCISLPFIKVQMDKLSPGDFVLTEVTFYDTKLGEEIPRRVSKVIHSEKPEVALARYTELSKIGVFACRPFDILFYKNAFVGNGDYIGRYTCLKTLKLDNLVEILPWDGPEGVMVKIAKEKKWEGFVLRALEKSEIGYTMDGKAHRKGSYKFKFTKTGDFIVDEAIKGISGKHSHFVAKFHIIELRPEGGTIDRGYVGPGKLSHDELKELTKELKSGKRRVPFVVEIEYASMDDESGKLIHGIIHRLREDKTPEECICEED